MQRWGSSLPSDRLKPAQLQPRPANQTNKKGKTKADEPKSKAVQKLEKQLKALLNSNNKNGNKDPRGGCFCLAREHPLSSYTPLCTTCGLILCNLNGPQFACPHCSASLLSSVQHSALVSRVQSEIADTLRKEEEARARAEEKARQEAGAFPSLTGQTTIPPRPPSGPGHVVLSLNSKTNKATISSARTTPVSSRPASRVESEEEGPTRVPAPAPEIAFSKQPIDPNRPWVNLVNQPVKYVPSLSQKKPQQKKKKAKETS
ncbi:hypothetical protein C8J56DRAFT_776564 [Mycena floridula]|nr:hypothetical protein C8J56DRAFT_776564 [Mycena floridula]